MVMLAPVGRGNPKHTHKPGGLSGAVIDHQGDNGLPPIQQTPLKNCLTEGVAEALKADKPLDFFKPDEWVPEPAVPFTGAKVYEVSLPGQPISTIRADDPSIAEARYRQLNGIIQTDKGFTITEIIEGGGVAESQSVPDYEITRATRIKTK